MRAWPAALLLAACAQWEHVSAATRAPPPGAAMVCVLRPAERHDALFAVRDNDAFVGVTGTSSYFCYYAWPGAHRLESIAVEERPSAPSALLLDVQANRRYFVEQVLTADGARHWLELLAPPLARSRLRGCDQMMLIPPRD
ncbi:MAG TPA: hypothetical protein VFF06_30530 [Polyangia bacterium]|nr:hypothetical protein [Polyangia bacterium]